MQVVRYGEFTFYCVRKLSETAAVCLLLLRLITLGAVTIATHYDPIFILNDTDT